MRVVGQVDVLGKVPLLEGLSKGELRSVARQAREDSFASGQEIVRQGSPGGRFYVVLSGRVKVSVGGRARRTLGPGSSFGEISLIDRGPRSATVIADSDVRALSLSSTNFLALLQENPTMARKVMVGLCRRIRSLDRTAG